MSSENQIVYLEAGSIDPHPRNPRQDLGDLAELAASIKAQGIMQNLTVFRQSVSSTGPVRYTALIGHRRLAAAKLAGLKEVPCVIIEDGSMDEKTQVGVMLLENMQRGDLTVLEQARGFQMMLDLGETTKAIAQKTGFSETTVRKRLFIASLDANKSKSAYERGATLDDYMKLQQITNEKRRSKVLGTLGTNNFDYNLRGALAEELRARVEKKIVKLVEAFATPTDKQSYELKGYGYYARCRYEDFEKTGELGIKLPKWKPGEYLYNASAHSVEIYKRQEGFKPELKMSELSPEAQEERREKRRKYKALKEMGETSYQLRLEFIKSFSQKSALTNAQLQALSELAFAAVCLRGEPWFDNYAFTAGRKTEEAWRLDYAQKKDAMRISEEPAARVLLLSLYSAFRDNAENTYFCGGETAAEKRGLHKENERLSAIYDCICALGYQMSDDERALRDGTHEQLTMAN